MVETGWQASNIMTINLVLMFIFFAMVATSQWLKGKTHYLIVIGTWLLISLLWIAEGISDGLSKGEDIWYYLNDIVITLLIFLFFFYFISVKYIVKEEFFKISYEAGEGFKDYLIKNNIKTPFEWGVLYTGRAVFIVLICVLVFRMLKPYII
jgi:hypothetical protein